MTAEPAEVESVEVLERRLQTAPADLETVAALNTLSWDVRASDPRRSLVLSREAYRRASQLEDLPGCALSLRNIGYCRAFMTDLPAARDTLRQALDLCRLLEDKRLEGDCLNGLGLTHHFAGDHTPAMEFYAQALTVRQASGDADGESATLNNIGLIYHLLGDHQTCIDYYKRSLQVPGADDAHQSMTLANIGRVYWDIGDYARARAYHEDCLRQSRRTDDRVSESYALSGLAVTLFHLAGFASAARLAAQAHALGVTLDRKYEQYESLHTLGRVADAQARYAEAVAYLERALTMQEDNKSLAEVWHSLGRVHLRRGASTQARTCFGHVLDLPDRGDEMKPLRAQAHQALAALCEQEDDLAGALTHYKTFHALEMEVSAAQVEKRTQAVLTHMEVEKVQNEAEAHRRHNEHLREINEALHTANEEKEQLLEELRAQSDELARQATEDALTGLHNRRYLEEWLAQSFAQAQRYGDSLTVVMADIDSFKTINDTFGHQSGDAVLKAVAAVLRAGCRAADLAARYGGEEFVLALPRTTAAQARHVCEKIRAAAEAYPWHTLHPALQVTLSLGLSDDLSADSHERLLSQADAKLYQAKHSGRNRICD